MSELLIEQIYLKINVFDLYIWLLYKKF